MKNTILLSETNGVIKIEIIPYQKPIIKLGLFVFGIALISAAIIIAKVTISAIIYTGFIYTDLTFIGFFIFNILIFIFFLYVGINRLKKLFAKEIIEFSEKDIAIINNVIGINTLKRFPLSDVSGLTFLGQHIFTKNHLDNNSTDFTGIGATENEIQYMLRDGTLGFIYKNKTIRFGMDLPTWDAELIIEHIMTFIKKNLTNDDYIRIIGNGETAKQD